MIANQGRRGWRLVEYTRDDAGAGFYSKGAMTLRLHLVLTVNHSVNKKHNTGELVVFSSLINNSWRYPS